MIINVDFGSEATGRLVLMIIEVGGKGLLQGAMSFVRLGLLMSLRLHSDPNSVHLGHGLVLVLEESPGVGNMIKVVKLDQIPRRLPVGRAEGVEERVRLNENSFSV